LKKRLEGDCHLGVKTPVELGEGGRANLKVQLSVIKGEVRRGKQVCSMIVLKRVGFLGGR